MAIPNSPTWSELQDIANYPMVSFTKPNKPTAKSSLSLGPALIGDSQSKLNNRYWAVYQSGADVLLVGAIGNDWDSATVLFQESGEISDIGLTFDQLGRAMVFYQVGNNLYLFWYDPTLEAQTVAFISTGTSLEAGFDIINNTSDPDSDAMIFYTRSNNICMRIQRERWEIEHAKEIFLDDGVTPVTGLELVSSGMRVDNRYQVVYRYRLVEGEDGGYTPPIVVPPEPPEVPNTPNYYRLQGNTSGISMGNNLWSLGQKLTVSIDFKEVDDSLDEVVLFSQSLLDSAAGAGETEGAMLVLSTYGTPGASYRNVYRVIYGGQETLIDDVGGFHIKSNETRGYEFRLSGVNEDGPLELLFSYPIEYGNTITNRLINSGTHSEPSAVFMIGSHAQERLLPPKHSFKGIISEARVVVDGVGRYIKLTDKADMIGDSSQIPVYDYEHVQITSAKIFAYLPNNWVYIAPDIYNPYF